MKKRYQILLIVALVSFYPCLSTQAKENSSKAEESFPFLARVTTEKVNVRAGQSENFEKIDVLNKEDEVIVVGKSYSWYKIRLPKTAQSFVIDKYVDVKADTAEITAQRVNLRAGPDVNRTALAQLDKGTKVKILEKLEGWYRVEPVEESYGWVSDEFLAFKSNVVSSPIVAVSNPPEKEESEVVESSSLGTSSAVITLKGILKAPVTLESNILEYQLLTDNKSVYSLQGMEHILKEFLHATVQIEGRIKEGQDQNSRPTVHVLKIQLVL